MERFPVQIGELADLTGVSRRSLRYYEQQGLLASSRGENGWRAYDEDAMVRAGNVRRLLHAGLSVKDIRQIAPCLGNDLGSAAACQAAIDMYASRIAALEEQIATLQRHRSELSDRLEGMLAQAAAAGHAPAPAPPRQEVAS